VLINTLHQVVVVPAAAVQRGPSGVFVYVVKGDQTVTVRKVTITQQDDQQAVIATGLTPGEQVVTTGFARLAEGTHVSTASAEAAGQITPKNELHKGRGKRGKRGASSNGQQSSSGGAASTQP
jgi:multidrug efflux system membrane fusion protein